ncbi:hypothetical protein P8825_15390 [Shouchella clausii]|uniref:hypothetical protein n=1 Tax=Shouchella clausii TaxID=79880 RepID=UPI002DBBF0D5|nr:hypothetical protein [Shouchella clausii]MEB5480949.1 hypothetical protein [Shouchella clausii]
MDLAIFKRDVFLCDDPINAVFKVGEEYEILGEDELFIYVNSKRQTNECAQIPKSKEGRLFEYV